MNFHSHILLVADEIIASKKCSDSILPSVRPDEQQIPDSVKKNGVRPVFYFPIMKSSLASSEMREWKSGFVNFLFLCYLHVTLRTKECHSFDSFCENRRSIQIIPGNGESNYCHI